MKRFPLIAALVTAPQLALAHADGHHGLAASLPHIHIGDSVLWTAGLIAGTLAAAALLVKAPVTAKIRQFLRK